MIYWAISLLFVIALILGLALLIKKFALPQNPSQMLFRKGKNRRLELIETLPLDHKSRLVLFRRDQTEHLILLSQNKDIIIESPVNQSLNKAPHHPLKEES